MSGSVGFQLSMGHIENLLLSSYAQEVNLIIYRTSLQGSHILGYTN